MCAVRAVFLAHLGDLPNDQPIRERQLKVDAVVLLFRFLVGFLLGGILFFCLSFGGEIPLKISGPIPFIVGLIAMIWGDKFILAFLKILDKLPI
jgi:hypothetical protein